MEFTEVIEVSDRGNSINVQSDCTFQFLLINESVQERLTTRQFLWPSPVQAEAISISPQVGAKCVGMHPEKLDNHAMKISKAHHFHSVPFYHLYVTHFCLVTLHTPRDHHTSGRLACPITPVYNLFYGTHYFFGPEKAAKMAQRDM
ncbi:unnamed protein product [Caenorhabditis brenneri]